MAMASEQDYPLIPQILRSVFNLQPKGQTYPLKLTLHVRNTTSTSSSKDLTFDPVTADRDLRVLRAKLGLQKKLTIHDLGWTREKAAQVRAQLAAFAEDWDDPSMDIYDQD